MIQKKFICLCVYIDISQDTYTKGKRAKEKGGEGGGG